jgi:glycosyltransferase involved in cell wall biosynthesis
MSHSEARTTEAATMTPGRVLFVISIDWAFATHRLALALALKNEGWEVGIATQFTTMEDEFRAAGLRTFPLQMKRRARSLFGEVLAIAELRRIFKAWNPDIVHQVALKPVIFGGLASLGLDLKGIVNAIAGLGFVFTSEHPQARAMRPALRLFFRMLLNRANATTIVQNPDDQKVLVASGVRAGKRLVLIRGAGVDTMRFQESPEPPGAPRVLFAGRLLRDKGVDTFIDAARILQARGTVVTFVLCGVPDPDSPSSVTADDIVLWVNEGLIEYLGRQTDMPGVLADSHIVTLPSRYGEGVPLILLEAAAAGKPIVTTDWPGCREVVEHEVTGLLTPPGDAEALADAITRLIQSPGLRVAYGKAARAKAVTEFADRRVFADVTKVYQQLLERGTSRGPC